MKTINIIAITLSLLAFAACDTTRDTLPDVSEGSIPVGFSSTVPKMRAPGYDTNNLPTSMGVFACFTHGNFNVGNSVPNFMYNQEVVRSGNEWTYSPIRFWPDNGTDKISFFAYAPYNMDGSNGLKFSGSTTAGYPVLAYTVPTVIADQQDLLASVPLMNQTNTSSSLKFILKHTLTRVNFTIKSPYDICVTSLSVNNTSEQGKLTFNATGFGWSDFVNTQNLTVPLPDSGITVTGNDESAMLLTTLFLLPNKGTATLSITYIMEGIGKIEKFNMALNDTPATWKQGNNVTYQLNVEKFDLTIIGSENGDWEPEGNDEQIESKEVAPGYLASDLKQGDYYYSDGKWSDGGYRKYTDGSVALRYIMPVLTDAQGKDRTVIGIVFQTKQERIGKAERDILATKSVTPHGLAISVKTTASAPWGPVDVDENLNNAKTLADCYLDISGLNNCQTIWKAYADNLDNYPAFKASKEFRDGSVTKAPEKSSGWFMPSMGQWWDILETLGGLEETLKADREAVAYYKDYPGGASIAVTNLNQFLNRIENKDEFAINTAFWSSTEIDLNDSRAILLHSGGALNIYYEMKTTPLGVRCILAF